MSLSNLSVNLNFNDFFFIVRYSFSFQVFYDFDVCLGFFLSLDPDVLTGILDPDVLTGILDPDVFSVI
jgi:hypothetical protein